MTRALMQSTQIQFYITVNVTVNADRVGWMILVLVAGLIRQIRCLLREGSLVVNDFIEAVHFTSTVFAIGFKSFVYGLSGVSL